VLISPAVTFGAAAGIFAAGLVIHQGIHFLPLKVTPKMPISKAVAAGKASVGDAGDEQRADIPAEPHMVNFDPSSAPTAEEISYHVYPPESGTPATAVPTEGADHVRFRFLEPADSKPDSDGSTHVEHAIAKAALDTDEKMEGVKAATATTGSGGSRPVADDHRVRALGLVRYDANAPPVATTPGARTAEPSLSTSFAPSQTTDSDPDHRRQAAQARVHLQVARLAQRISSAIQADDHQQTQLLLTRLAEMKGPQNDFVLKLNAYALIRQNRLDEARTLLADLLARDATDLEAGLNMAVVDMKTGRLEGARRRLGQLQELYPEDRHIALYLRQLPSKR
jgi:hypothetical protein